MTIAQLYKKYPKSVKRFMKRRLKIRSMTDPIYDIQLKDCHIDVRKQWKEITDFMDEHRIILEITYDYTKYFLGTIFYFSNEECLWAYTGRCKTRNQAETKGICKLFQILNERSK